MKINKGFTLMELLAVIIVLAIIALVATPIVTNTITNVKRSSAMESVNNLINSAELYFATKKPNYGKIDVLSTELKYNGKKPEQGEIEINNKGQSRIYAYVDGYCVTKEYESETYATKMDKEDCGWYATDNYETIDGTTFTIGNKENNKENNIEIKNYLIYGNSIQNVRSGKNLLNMEKFTTSYTNNYYQNKTTNFKLVAGKTYTLSFDYKVTSATTKLSTGIGYGTSFYSADIIYSKAYPNNTSGRQTVTFTAPTDLADGNYLCIRFARTGVADSVSVDISSIQLEEGNTATFYEEYGVSPSVDYPSEIKNVGDLITNANCNTYGGDACNNIGKYVIQVKASKKNLFDYDNVIQKSHISKITNGYEVSGYNNILLPTYQTLENYLGKTVTISFDLETSEDGEFSFYQYQGSGIGIEFKTVTKNMTANTPTRITLTGKVKNFINNSTYSKGEINVYKSDYKGSYKMTNIQFELGDSATTYEEYTKKITNIYLDEPLRKVGDAVDYIDFHNKQIVRNVKVEDSTNTKTIEESYEKLGTPVIESIDLPSIGLLDGYNNITINTVAIPSNVILTINK